MIKLQVHSNGIFNQILSSEVSYGLAALGYDVVLYNYPAYLVPRNDVIYSKYFQAEDKVMSIFDLIDTPDFITLQTTSQKLSSGDRLINYYASSSYGNKQFSMGRELLKKDLDYEFLTDTYAYYSSFFHDRTAELDKTLMAIKPKIEYEEFALHIASHIGQFNGIHLRRTDHIPVVDLAKYEINLDRLSSDIPLFICTDDPSFADEIDGTNMDNFILENFMDEFLSLGTSTGHTLAFVSALVMGYANDFIGTETSTYTGYIQRRIFLRDNSYVFKFFNEYKLDYGPTLYSWNSYANRFIGAPYGVALIRDWPEAKFMI